MDKYKCISVNQHELWLTVGKIYDAEQMIPPLVRGESWLEIKRADDGFKAFARANQFQIVFNEKDELGV